MSKAKKVQIPKRDEFTQAWRVLQARGVIGKTYDVKKDPYLGTNSLSDRDLWNMILDASKSMDNGDENAKEFVVSTLQKFGF